MDTSCLSVFNFLVIMHYPNPKNFDTLEAFQKKAREVRSEHELHHTTYPANTREAFERVLLKHYDRAHGTHYFN